MCGGKSFERVSTGRVFLGPCLSGWAYTRACIALCQGCVSGGGCCRILVYVAATVG